MSRCRWLSMDTLRTIWISSRRGIEGVTSADVARVANKYVDVNKLAIVVVGNQSEFGTPLDRTRPGEESRHRDPTTG